MLSYYIILFILGSCFGSFSTVLISRWKNKKSGIVNGRSECPSCGHTLGADELIPIFSWLYQGGRCKNCGVNISPFYPVSELLMGVGFVWSGWILMNFGFTWMDIFWWIFLFWTFTTIVYTIYDIRYFEIPDEILIPSILLSLGVLVLGYTGYIKTFDSLFYASNIDFLRDHIFAAIILYSFFYLQILIPGGIHLIRTRRYKDLIGLIVNYVIFPLVIVIEFLTPKKYRKTKEDTGEEIPTWIGGGDLRIAIFIGLTLGGIHSLASLVFAYTIGSIIGILLIMRARYLGEITPKEIPFGPFLAIGWFLSITLYEEILNYLGLFL